REGQSRGAPNSGAVLRPGRGWGADFSWRNFNRFVSGGDGIFYAVGADAKLYWFRDLARDGTREWAPNSAAVVSNGWGDFSHVITGGDGVIYAISSRDGNLLWYRHLGKDDGAPTWANNGAGKDLSWGLVYRALEGYTSTTPTAAPFSVSPGETIDFHISTSAPSYIVTYIRLAQDSAGSLIESPMDQPFARPGYLRATPNRAWETSPAWPIDFS